MGAGGQRMIRAAVYLQVLANNQTTQSQLEGLRTVAAQRGWDVVAIYEDAGVGREQRPGLNAMLKDASTRKFEVVMAWALERLGWSTADLCSTIQHLQACGVALYLEQQLIDTTAPSGNMIFQLTGAFAELERSRRVERVNAGLRRGRTKGVKLGRPRIKPSV